MDRSLNEIVAEKNEMVRKGQVVEASEKFFATNAKTVDFSGAKTNSRAEMVDKMKGFTGGIGKVNGITLHRSALADDVSFAEFTFDFDMKDGSKTFWHEIIRSVWKDGKIVEEEYFGG
jgi:hypothetical protein